MKYQQIKQAIHFVTTKIIQAHAFNINYILTNILVNDFPFILNDKPGTSCWVHSPYSCASTDKTGSLENSTNLSVIKRKYKYKYPHKRTSGLSLKFRQLSIENARTMHFRLTNETSSDKTYRKKYIEKRNAVVACSAGYIVSLDN
jgi:hypothetical protein